MAKCIRCGKSTALRGHVKIKDADLCGVCFKDLGFDRNDILTASIYAYNDIKDGRDTYYQKLIDRRAAEYDAKNASVSFGNYGQDRNLDCTEAERDIFNRIREIFPSEDLRLVRASDNYVTIKRGDWDIVRAKFTNRAKWLMFPTVEAKQVKHPIEDVTDCDAFSDLIRESLEMARKYEV